MGGDVSDWEMVEVQQPTPHFLLTGLDPYRAYAIKVNHQRRSKTDLL